MRVKSFIFGRIILSAAFIFFVYSEPVEAAEINFSQSILPVRFVYVDQNREILDIWNNIGALDSLYVIKFFDSKLKTEIGFSEKTFLAYQKIIIENEAKVTSRESFTVEFVSSGGITEEIRTYT